MRTYLMPIQTAIFTFIVLSGLITFPYLAWKYHKRGALTFWQMVVEYAMVFYLLTAFFMTLLPLPTIAEVAKMTGPTTQLIPFRFVSDFLRETKLVWGDSSTYAIALTQGVVIQPLFNIVLTIPLGVFLRYYYKRSFTYTLTASFLLSLFFEVTQLTGVYWLYPRAFRLFDVDDLLLNTLGGIVGYWLTPLLVFFFPTKEDIERQALQKAATVSFIRRFIAYSIDLILIRFIVGFFFSDELVIFFFFALLTSLTMIYTKGQTLGSRFVHLKVVSQTAGALTTKQILIRQFSFYFFIHVIFVVFALPLQLVGENLATLLIYLILLGAYTLFLAVHFIVRTFGGQKIYFYEALSKTYLVSSLPKKMIKTDD